MAIRKKKRVTLDAPATEEPKTQEEGRVSQVVEVVEEPDKAEALSTIKEDAQEIEAVAEELEHTSVSEPMLDEQEDKFVNKEEDMPMGEENEKQKEVVEELFQRDSSQVPSEITEGKKGSSKKLLVWAAIVISVALLVGGGLVAVTSGSFSVPFVAEPTPTPTPEPTPTPIPLADLKREDLTIEVLNGGGTPGAAGKMKAYLEGKGYTVTSVGNTEEYTYEQTEIHLKEDKAAYRSLLSEDLQGDYTISSDAAILEEDAEADARIIVGKE